MKPKKVRLFIKPYCGWCHDAQDWLQERGIQYDELDVTSDRAARQEMFDLTGQSKAPCIEVDGEILADFDTDQLEEFWKKLVHDMRAHFKNQDFNRAIILAISEIGKLLSAHFPRTADTINELPDEIAQG